MKCLVKEDEVGQSLELLHINVFLAMSAPYKSEKKLIKSGIKIKLSNCKLKGW